MKIKRSTISTANVINENRMNVTHYRKREFVLVISFLWSSWVPDCIRCRSISLSLLASTANSQLLDHLHISYRQWQTNRERQTDRRERNGVTETAIYYVICASFLHGPCIHRSQQMRVDNWSFVFSLYFTSHFFDDLLHFICSILPSSIYSVSSLVIAFFPLLLFFLLFIFSINRIHSHRSDHPFPILFFSSYLFSQDRLFLFLNFIYP